MPKEIKIILFYSILFYKKFHIRRTRASEKATQDEQEMDTSPPEASNNGSTGKGRFFNKGATKQGNRFFSQDSITDSVHATIKSGKDKGPQTNRSVFLGESPNLK